MKSWPLRSAIPQPLFPVRAAGTQQVDKTLVSSGNTSSFVLNRVSWRKRKLTDVNGSRQTERFREIVRSRVQQRRPRPASLYKGNQKEAAGGSQFIWR